MFCNLRNPNGGASKFKDLRFRFQVTLFERDNVDLSIFKLRQVYANGNEKLWK